jgi:lipopolysaccharide transport system permease protein
MTPFETTSYSAPEKWDNIIKAERPTFRIPWRELWQYRDLIALLVHRDVTSTYKQTVLGPIWYFLQPLFTTIVFSIVFGNIAKLPTDGVPPMLFYMSGVVIWGYFQNCLTRTSGTFTSNSGLFGKVYFPRMAIPIATVLTNIVGFGIQLIFFALFYVFFLLRGADVMLSWRLIILPVLVLQMAMLGLGVGCLVSSLTTKYRDFGLLVGFGTQLWMYASCVVFPLSLIPLEWRLSLIIFNPMVPVIESFRFAVLGSGIIELWQLGLSFLISALVLLWGVAVFSRVEKTFMDTV